MDVFGISLHMFSWFVEIDLSVKSFYEYKLYHIYDYLIFNFYYISQSYKELNIQQEQESYELKRYNYVVVLLK